MSDLDPEYRSIPAIGILSFILWLRFLHEFIFSIINQFKNLRLLCRKIHRYWLLWFSLKNMISAGLGQWKSFNIHILLYINIQLRWKVRRKYKDRTKHSSKKGFTVYIQAAAGCAQSGTDVSYNGQKGRITN